MGPKILILGLLSTCPLWENIQCKATDFTLDAPGVVSVQVGLCVIIPCRFTYPASSKASTDELYGYWYVKGSKSYRDPSVATNDRRKEVADYTRDRFHLSEGLEEGDCSLIIQDAQERDQKTYFFRMEKGNIKYTYITVQPSVMVTREAQPEMHPVLAVCLSTAIPFLLGLFLIKVLFCFLFFLLTFWYLNWRKRALQVKTETRWREDLLKVFCPGKRTVSRSDVHSRFPWIKELKAHQAT